MKLAVLLFSAASLVTVSAWAQTSTTTPAPDAQAAPAAPAPDTEKAGPNELKPKLKPKHATRHTHLRRHKTQHTAGSGFGQEMETTLNKGLHVLTDGTRHAQVRHESYRKYSASCKAGLTNRYGYLRGTSTNHAAPC